MANESQYNELLDAAMTGRMDRRQLLRRAMVLGLSVPAISALLAACGDDEEEDPADAAGDVATEVEGEATEAEEEPTEAEEEATVAEEEPTEEDEAEATETQGSGVVPGSPPAEGSPTAGATGEYEYGIDNPPPVANAEEASQYSGTRIVYWGDAVGPGAVAGETAAARFTEETGIEVEVIPRPESATESYAQYQRIFQGQSGDMDCGMIDVIWPGAFAQHLEDLSDAFPDAADVYYETVVENNTIDGKLVAIPWFGDFGMLYYRTDLMEKYGFDGPPDTWQELEEQANTVMEGERGEGNAEFTGFVFQGNAYEGLTTNALEWLASTGAGNILEDGEVTLNNETAIETLGMAQSWVGSIAPQGVTTYQEEDARNVFQGGNSMFMRNWPYAYSAGQADDSPISGSFDVYPVPATEGQDKVGTVGGWQLAVNTYSQNKEAAIEFVRYLGSPEMQKWRAIHYSFVPNVPSVSEDPQVIEAMPFLSTMTEVTRVTRPSREAGDLYNEFSTIFFQGVNQILNGEDPANEVPAMAEDIEDLLG